MSKLFGIGQNGLKRRRRRLRYARPSAKNRALEAIAQALLDGMPEILAATSATLARASENEMSQIMLDPARA